MPSQDVVHDPEKRIPAMDVTVDSSSGAKPESCLSVSHGTTCASSHESSNARDSDPGHELLSTSNPAFSDIFESRQPTWIVPNPTDGDIKEDIAYDDVSSSHCQDSCSVVPQNASSDSMYGNTGVATIAKGPVAPTEPHVPAACEKDHLISTVLDVAPESIQVMPEASGASSSYASIMHSDDKNVKECEKGRCEVVFRDLEADLPIDVGSSVDEEGMLGVDLADDHKCSTLLEATKGSVPVEAHDDRHPASSCDVKDLVDSELREPLLSHVKTDDTKSSQEKDFLLSGENELGGESLSKETEVHGLRTRRGDAIKPSTAGDSGPGKMPEEQKKGVTSTRTKDASTEVSQEVKQKPVNKKSGKQGKGAGKPSAAVKRPGDAEPLVEELRAKEEAETNRKVHESLDNFIRQTIRCEPYMNFTSRPGDNKPLQRLRPDVFENHVAGKLARGFNVQNGPDPRDIVLEENRGVDSNSNDIDGSKDGSTGSAKGIAGFTRGAQQSLKIPPGAVAFTQASAKGTDLQGWLPPKTKCEKCAREFSSTFNYRRHSRGHRRPNSEKEDLSKERSNVAAFWDKLSPEVAGSIVHYADMVVEEPTSGAKVLEALQKYVEKPGLASLPQGVLKTGSSPSLPDIVQNKSSVRLSSERLLAILDDASEKTFLCEGTSITVQRNLFKEETVPLEDKNVLALLGFLIELRLVKEWMVDKAKEADRNQEVLLNEEEAEHQQRIKRLEKKRQKKIRQKERKGSTSQQVLQELENESIEDESNVQGIGEEGDSPTGTGSSSSSLAFAQDLALPKSAELNETDVLGPTYDVRGHHELVLGEKSDTGKNISSDEDQLHRSRDGLSQYGREGQQIGSRRGEDLYRREDSSAIESGAHSQLRSTDHVGWDGDLDSRSAYPSYQSRSGGKREIQTNLNHRKGEQDRIDPKRRDFERYPLQERRASRNGRDRLPRNDHSEQKLLRDSRGSDTRYGDIHLTSFKNSRKSTSHMTKSDSGNADLSSSSRMQQNRSKPLGIINRASSTAGNQNVVWTKKVSQSSAAVEATANIQEEIIHDDAENATKVDDCAVASEALPKVALSVPDSEKVVAAAMSEEEKMEKEDAAAVPPDGVVVNDTKTVGSRNDVISTEDMRPEDEDEDSSNTISVGSLSVSLRPFSRKPIMEVYASYHKQNPDKVEVRNVSASGSHGESHRNQEAALSSKIHTATGVSSDGSEPLKASTNSKSNSVISTQQGAKSKSQLSSSSPERGENSWPNAAAKPGGSWPTSVGRYSFSPAKVWRAVVVVEGRSDSSEARPFQVLDALGTSEGKRETSPKAADVGLGGSPTQDNEFLSEDAQDGDDPNDGHTVVKKTNDDEAIFSASSAARSEPGHVSQGKADYISETKSNKAVESGIAASAHHSFSDFVEASESFFSERWRVGLAHASEDEVLQVTSDVSSTEVEGLDFPEKVYLQFSKGSCRQSSGAAESGSSPSVSVVSTELSGVKPARDGAVVLSKVFDDSEHTGLEDVRGPSTIDEEARDGASPQAPSSEDDAGMRNASTSPIGSEYDMSGSEMASSIPSASGENLSESRGGGVCLSYPRRGNRRQERWHRNFRDRFPEQRYMARRRAATVEKKDC